MRPEFVKSYPVPLCSDAFSAFITSDPKSQEYNEEIRKATEYLFTKLIPEFAQELVDMMAEADKAGNIQSFSLVQSLHSKGVSIRHLGVLLHHVESLDHPFKDCCADWLRVEMVSRVLKDMYRSLLRERMEQLQVPLEHPYVRVVSEFLNRIFGNSVASDKEWDQRVNAALVEKFGQCPLMNKKRHDKVTFKAAVMRKVHLSLETPVNGAAIVFHKLQESVGFVLRSEIQDRVLKLPEEVFSVRSPFEPLYITDIGDRIKYMSVISQVQAIYYELKGASLNWNPDLAIPLFQKACKIYNQLLQIHPNNSETLRHLAHSIISIEALKFGQAKNPPSNLPQIVRGLKMYEQAIKLSPNDVVSWLMYAKNLYGLRKFHEAEEAFVRCLEINPNYPAALKTYAHFLGSQGRREESTAIMARYHQVSDSIKPTTKKIRELLELENKLV